MCGRYLGLFSVSPGYSLLLLTLFLLLQNSKLSNGCRQEGTDLIQEMSSLDLTVIHCDFRRVNPFLEF